MAELHIFRSRLNIYKVRSCVIYSRKICIEIWLGFFHEKNRIEWNSKGLIQLITEHLAFGERFLENKIYFHCNGNEKKTEQ